MEVHGFRYYFTPLTGVLFTFRSRYYSLSVTKEYLALRGGPRRFTPGSTGLALLGNSAGCFAISPTGLSPSLARLSSRFDYRYTSPSHVRNRACGSHNPRHATLTGLHMPGLGSSLFARRYWGNRCIFLFLQVLRWVSSLRSPPCAMDSHTAHGRLDRVVSESGTPPGQRLLASLRGISQLSHVLRRLLVPRHPHVHPF